MSKDDCSAGWEVHVIRCVGTQSMIGEGASRLCLEEYIGAFWAPRWQKQWSGGDTLHIRTCVHNGMGARQGTTCLGNREKVSVAGAGIKG